MVHEVVTLKSGSYILAVQAPMYRISENSFAVESAFSHHIKQIKEQFSERITKFVVIAPQMSEETYRSNTALATIDAEDGITLVPGHPEEASPAVFWAKHAARIWREVKACMGEASIVHSGMSSDVWRPLMVLVNIAAWSQRKPIMFVVDIDFRNNTRRLRQLRLWSFRSYLTNRLFHDPIRWMQVWLAVRVSRLVLLKSPQLVRDFGLGKPHVKNFLDTAYSAEHVLSNDELSRRLGWLQCNEGPFKLVYFGRLVQYKGLHLAIEAVRLARSRGIDIRLSIIGDGPCLQDLQQRAESADLSEAVTFLPPVKYGEPLFQLLAGCHATVACPLVEDTPRAAIDSLAQGLPIVAFDLDYFQGLAEMSGAVTLARWPSAETLADALIKLSQDRQCLVDQSRRAVEFARVNTQQIWLERRHAWVEEHLLGRET